MTIQNARKSAFWASMVAVCLAAATAVGAERTLSADGKTLTFDIPADSVYTNTVTIESTVTNIVKVGGGRDEHREGGRRRGVLRAADEQRLQGRNPDP